MSQLNAKKEHIYSQISKNIENIFSHNCSSSLNYFSPVLNALVLPDCNDIVLYDRQVQFLTSPKSTTFFL